MKLNKDILFIEDSNYYVNLLLIKKDNNTGVLDSDENSDIIIEGEIETLTQYDDTITTQPDIQTVFTTSLVTGETESRLDEVKRYNISEPYLVGVNGVTEITSEYISYVIDDITLKTFLNEDDRTIYAFGTKPLDTINVGIFKDENKPFHDKRKTISDIFIARGDVSVFNSHLQVSNIKNMSDIKTITSFVIHKN